MKTARKFISMVMVICISMLIACNSFLMTARADGIPKGSIATVTAETKLNLRSEPQGEIIGKLPHGETVTILSERDRNGYYYVRVHKTGLECYAYGEYLALKETPNTNVDIEPDHTQTSSNVNSNEQHLFFENATLIVFSEQKLNLRKKPSRKANRIIYLEMGDKLEVVSTKVKNNYILVRDIATEKVGYVDIGYVALYTPEYDNNNTNNHICDCINCSCNCKQK